MEDIYVGTATFIGVLMFIFSMRASDDVKFIFYAIFSSLTLAIAAVLAMNY